ncbi:MAG: right-handed parallel beta-helix repeat-containing protein [Planctomycetaceae bacterium]|nr:right-handed parallel beta-helix repeat-containing protein [Planctomycetaceae bacterium]
MKLISRILCVLLISQLVHAGNLEPSAPPTSGTMKPLDQIEPRTAITTVPFTISTSGSCYLAGDLVSTSSGIMVNADDVTIDFCGFAIVGPGTANYSGVDMFNRKNVEIRNGTLRAFGYGIKENNADARYHRVIDMRVLNNKVAGIQLFGTGHVIRGCTVAYNGGVDASALSFGISAGFRAIVSGNSVYNNGNSSRVAVLAISASDGSTITDNSCCDNGTSATVVSSEGYVYGIKTGYNCLISGNNVSHNGSGTGLSFFVYGIKAESGSTIIRNTASGNGSATTGTCFGIHVAGSVVDQNAAYDNNGVTKYQLVAISCSTGTNYPAI